MALVNCTINSTSFSVAKDQALTSLVSDKVLVITPNSGHVCAATSFIVDGALPSGVSSINLSDSDVAFSNNNTVLVTIDLDDSFVPSADTVITIDIALFVMHRYAAYVPRLPAFYPNFRVKIDLVLCQQQNNQIGLKILEAR